MRPTELTKLVVYVIKHCLVLVCLYCPFLFHSVGGSLVMLCVAFYISLTSLVKFFSWLSIFCVVWGSVLGLSLAAPSVVRSKALFVFIRRLVAKMCREAFWEALKASEGDSTWPERLGIKFGDWTCFPFSLGVYFLCLTENFVHFWD